MQSNTRLEPTRGHDGQSNSTGAQLTRSPLGIPETVEGSINGQHLSWIAVIMMLLTAVACTDSPTAPPLSTPPSLESSTLFSGGEGILVSESYRSIELAPLIDLSLIHI